VESQARRTPNIEGKTPVSAQFARMPVGAAASIFAAVTLLAACGRGDEKHVEEIRPVRVVTIEKSQAGSTLTLTGTLQAQTEVNQSFRIDGRLIERSVDVGDRVRPGQILARLDRMNEESNLESARAQLGAAEARAVEAHFNFIRMRDLVAEHAVSRASFEQAEAMYKVTQSQVTSARALADIAQNRLSYTNLVADMAGVVTARGPEPGEVVSAGRMIVQVAREGAVDAVFDVPARIKNIAPPNPQITVVLTSDPRVTAEGRVREVSPRADPVTGTFAVRVQLINPTPTMRLGSTVTGRMTLATTSSIEIPASALIRPGNKPAVWLVNTKTGTVSVRDVVLQAFDAERVQVSSGLEAGDVIVTAGVQALRPAQKVRWAHQ
jgi:RND family efflux transporter MFP subunit